MDSLLLTASFSLWAFGVGEMVNVIIILIVVVGPFLKSIYDSYVEAQNQAKQKQAQQASEQLIEYIINQEKKQEEIVLAEAVLQPEQERFETLPSQQKEKRKPKIRSKNKPLKAESVDQALQGDVTPPPSQPAPAPIPRSSRQVSSPLAESIVKMLQDPVGVRQAVVISEILKRKY